MQDDIRIQQIEALKTLYEYNKRLINAIPQLVTELREERKPDTDEYQNKIIEGLNWEIAILNGILPLLKEGSERLSKESLNTCFRSLEKSLASHMDVQISNVLEQEILPALQQLDEVSAEVLLTVL